MESVAARSLLLFGGDICLLSAERLLQTLFLARYGDIFLIVGCVWGVFGYLFGKYRSLAQSRYRLSVLRLVLTALCTLAVALVLVYLGRLEFSVLQTVSLIGTVFLQNLLIVGFVHIFYYAAYIDEQPRVEVQREPAQVLAPPQQIDAAEVAENMHNIATITSPDVQAYICSRVDVASSNTLFLSTTNLFNYTALPHLSLRCDCQFGAAEQHSWHQQNVCGRQRQIARRR